MFIIRIEFKTIIFFIWICFKMSEPSKKFWSCSVSSNSPQEISVPETAFLVISNACIFDYPENQAPSPTRVYSCPHVEGTASTDQYIAVLVPNRKEHTTLSYKLSPGLATTIGVYGAAIVHLSGYFVDINGNDADYEEEDLPDVQMPQI